jgi:hypothetical protein
MYLGICERVAENGDSFPPHPTHRFDLFRAPGAKRVRFPLSLHLLPSNLFWLLKLCPQNGRLSTYSAVMAGGIYGMLFPSSVQPSLPSRSPSLSSGVYSLFSRIHISSHGRTVIAILAYLFPPTLDDSRFSRFYERLFLLEVLRREPNTPTGSVEVAELTSSSTAGLRKSFVDGIANLCASERFSNLRYSYGTRKETIRPGPWFATNDGVSDSKIAFLEDVLENFAKSPARALASNCMQGARASTKYVLRIR